VGQCLVAVEELQDRAPEEGAENRLQAEPLGKHDENSQQGERRADANLRCWSCRRTSVAERRIECSAPSTATPTASTNNPNRPGSTSFAPISQDSLEKKSDSKTIVAISVIEAPATTNCPNRVAS
jgi:hypothetical protein